MANVHRSLVMICRTGVRSSAAVDLLERDGFSQVFDVAGDPHGSVHAAGWIGDGLPMESCERC